MSGPIGLLGLPADGVVEPGNAVVRSCLECHELFPSTEGRKTIKGAMDMTVCHRCNERNVKEAVERLGQVFEQRRKGT